MTFDPKWQPVVTLGNVSDWKGLSTHAVIQSECYRAPHSRKQLSNYFTPLSTTGLWTPFLIGSYHEMFTCLPIMKGHWKMFTTYMHMRLLFLTPSLIGLMNDRIFILTNRLVVLIIFLTLSFKYCCWYTSFSSVDMACHWAPMILPILPTPRSGCFFFTSLYISLL